jgi:hypothetical protein
MLTVMAQATREPRELIRQMSLRFQGANIPHRQQAEALLAWAWFNLDAAQLGWDVFQRALPDGDDNLTGHEFHTVEFAALNLIFRGVVSAMDQCAAAVFRLTGEPYRANREPTVGWWFDQRANPPWHLVPTPLTKWLQGFDGNATWELLNGFRQAFTHRTVQRHVTVSVGRESQAHQLELELQGARHGAWDLMSRFLTFGKRRFSTFERALAKSYPLR